MMTRKHYKMIADSFKMTVNQGGNVEDLRALALTLCTEFKRENSRFDAIRFVEASGLAIDYDKE